MTSNSGNDVQNLLECPVCMESYEESGRRTPKMLPCQHSFCVDCLKTISSGGRIQCPSCRRQICIPVKELPTSLVLIQLLDARGTSSNKDNDNALVKYIHRLYNWIANGLRRFIQIATTTFFLVSLFLRNAALSVTWIIEVITRPILDFLEATLDAAKDKIKKIRSFRDNLFASITLIPSPTTSNSMKSECLNFAHLLIENMSKNRKLEKISKSRKLALEQKCLYLLNEMSENLSRSDNANLGDIQNVEALLSILKKKLRARSRDATFFNLLSLFIRLTDETPSTCRNIVDAEGLTIFCLLLKEKHFSSCVGDVLLILSNLAEEPETCRHFLKDKHGLVGHILKLMNSRETPTSYCAALVISRLLTIDLKEWKKLTNSPNLRNRTLSDMSNCVIKWDTASEIGITFRSFKPFYPLLQRYDAPPLQLFAVWTIWKFCLNPDKKYQQILINEQGIDYLLELTENPYADNFVKMFAVLTLKLIEQRFL
uniref:protein zyg-11 homolog B-like n=1 Tax=Styela clava TaxID=7725 RepID=UPI00193A323A|nr:protein zyg-11 homolog B-like [Styela clava]